MKIDEIPTYFVPRPDDGEQADLVFELRESWYALDGDKLVLPITAIEKNGQPIEKGTCLLSQYGGSELMLNMASSDQDLEEGTRWMLSHRDGFGFVIEPV